MLWNLRSDAIDASVGCLNPIVGLYFQQGPLQCLSFFSQTGPAQARGVLQAVPAKPTAIGCAIPHRKSKAAHEHLWNKFWPPYSGSPKTQERCLKIGARWLTACATVSTFVVVVPGDPTVESRSTPLRYSYYYFSILTGAF